MKKIFFLLLFCLPFSVISQILKKPVPDKLVVLTFDDAPASHYSVVAPLLQEHGFNGTFYVCEFPPNFSDSSKYMNWRQIQALDKMGFDVANHTRTHAHVNALDKEEIQAQLGYIEAKCDSLGIPKPSSFAYPAYDISESCFEVLDEKGYDFARAGGKRAYAPLKDHPYLIPSWAMEEDNKDEIMEALKKAKNGKIVVLTIHGVPDIEHPWVNTPPALFEEYLDYLSANDYKVISIKDLKEYIDPLAARHTITMDMSKSFKN
ncbi:polysaccharide deacetylase family protein [Echinicola jeungdonensis]|uniref:Polysaccharide deacetylase family protein n=1 Tax=Echinicola jeungdonensis TaxID=709343 RepID=A0ABV5J8A1_9BACT|nr:polysaccharide deacetylase family protein [Echinicola jeungdonensis]MDN3669506.1 polysaccharide deacetylase family protein [Echinicola jeungdonensis]